MPAAYVRGPTSTTAGSKLLQSRSSPYDRNMARTQGSRAYVSGSLIREQARRLCARKGYASVSMRQIAAEVGVQAGALYAYTRDKQTLLFELLEEHMLELLAAWRDDPGGMPLD